MPFLSPKPFFPNRNVMGHVSLQDSHLEESTYDCQPFRQRHT
ncbi:hypothetical protein J2Y66_001336 [Paenarthrobacter nitroguajacolicus]|nr:hypothetical protein [Paenarthrobacter nitroguajacolicus]